MITCHECGRRNEDGSAYCQNASCGRPLDPSPVERSADGLTVRLEPRVSYGRTNSTHRVVLTSATAAVVEVEVTAAAKALDPAWEPVEVALTPGEPAEVRVKLHAVHKHRSGPPQPRPFTVSVSRERGTPLTVQGVLVQTSRVPKAAKVAVGLVVLGGAVAAGVLYGPDLWRALPL